MGNTRLDIIAYLAGPVLGFLAGPGIAFATATGCVIDVPGGCVTGLALGGLLGAFAGRRLRGRRLTIGMMMLFIAGAAVYLAVFGWTWAYL